MIDLTEEVTLQPAFCVLFAQFQFVHVHVGKLASVIMFLFGIRVWSEKNLVAPAQQIYVPRINHVILQYQPLVRVSRVESLLRLARDYYIFV